MNLVIAAALTAVVIPVAAEHTQTAGTGSPFAAQFDHDGDNAWWVEFQARSVGEGSIFLGQVQVEGSSTLHGMNFAANAPERQQQGWHKFAPEQAFQVPTGKRVMFWVSMSDAAGNLEAIGSCWFTHPAGVEQCGSGTTSSTTSTTASTTTTTGSGSFDAPFTGVRGNAWWIQANVGTSGPSIAKVDVTLDKGASWKPLAKQSWGATA